ncbi:MAG: hypothetical protein ABJA82_15815 [Myxococcales bacterium]
MKSVILSLVVAGMLAGPSGCGSDSKSGAPDGGGGSPDAGGGKDLSRFIGTWKPTSGTLTTTCAGQSSTDAVTDNTVWAAGISSDLVQTDGSCALMANVTGSTASALPSQSCTQMSGTTTATLSTTAYTFSLSADGQTATESGSGILSGNSGGVAVSCSISITAAYQKIAN